MQHRYFNKRAKKIKKAFREHNIKAFVICNPENVTYATGFTGHDSWAVLTQRNFYLITDSRYTEQARSQCPQLKVIERTSGFTEYINKIIRRYKDIEVTVENDIPLSIYKGLKSKLQAKVRTNKGLFSKLRSVKDDHEIEQVKKAARIAVDAFNNARNYLKEGITEIEAAGIVDLEIRRLGGLNSFDTIVAFGKNASRPHHQPGLTRLKKNDTILIDMGAKFNGYCSDITRSFCIGKVNKKYQKIHDIVQKAHDEAIKKVKNGVYLKKVDLTARKIIEEADLPVYGHGTGHGIGLNVHEHPVVSANSRGKLRSGNIITIEPGVYIPQKLGIRIEDDVLVTDTGSEVITG